MTFITRSEYLPPDDTHVIEEEQGTRACLPKVDHRDDASRATQTEGTGDTIAAGLCCGCRGRLLPQLWAATCP